MEACYLERSLWSLHLLERNFKRGLDCLEVITSLKGIDDFY